MDSIAGIITYCLLYTSTKVRSYYNNFVIQQGSALVHLAFSAIQLLQGKTLKFLFHDLQPNNSPELNSTDREIARVISACA